MTELSFLVELLLNHKLPKLTKEAVAKRISEVESLLSVVSAPAVHNIPARMPVNLPPHIAAQTPATQAIMLRHANIDHKPETMPVLVPDPPAPGVIAATPAAVAAMESRNNAINASLSGKIDKTHGRPRKF